MDDDGAMGGDRWFDPAFPMEFMLEGWRLGQMPLIFATFWWNNAIEAFWPRSPAGRHFSHHEEHEQLVVPEPIEEDGEHALFA